jgi:ArsR family transcriptional regulator, arsenate/arsenite/antimonite-responsive transcriptional repressor
MKKNKDFRFEQFFKALADHTRLRVIHLLGTDEVCVCSVVKALQTSQPKISRHLAYLKRAGLVSARREGKWMHYRVVEPTDLSAAKIFREVRERLSQDFDMQRDRERLCTDGRLGAHTSANGRQAGTQC